MDLALTIWHINPAAEYRLTEKRDAILEWRGPGPQPTADELAAAWAQYQAAHPDVPAAPAVDPAAIGAALAALPADQPLTKADLAPLLALFGAGK